VAHHPTALGNPGSPISIQALKVYKISLRISINMSVTNDYKTKTALPPHYFIWKKSKDYIRDPKQKIYEKRSFNIKIKIKNLILDSWINMIL